MAAMILSSPLQFGQCSMSISNSRLRNRPGPTDGAGRACAQPSSVAAARRAPASWPCPAGTTSPLSLALGPSTPWKRIRCSCGRGTSVHSVIVAPYLLHYGTESQQQQLLPRMAGGEVISAIGMTEPGAGSNLAGIPTRAVPLGQGWRINGQKIFISNGQLADLVLLAAKTDPDQGAKGVSLLLVDTQTPGFSRGRRLEKLGMHAQDTIKLFFTDVEVGPDALLGPAGSGFNSMMKARC